MIVHLSLTFIVVLFCAAHSKSPARAKYALFVSFSLLALYLAFMYDYGLDYWNYYDIFYHDRHYGDERVEPFFWNLFFAFPNYYLFVAFYGILLSSAIYIFIRQNIPPRYYAFFLLIFMLHPSLCLNMTYVFRSALGSCIVWFAFSQFYIRRINYCYLFLLILFAALFHHSLALCFLLPLINFLLQKVPGKIIFIMLIIALWIGMLGALDLFASTIGAIEGFDGYVHYADTNIDDFSVAMIGSRALHLIPAFFILYYRNQSDYVNRLSSICIVYYMLYFIGLDLLGRLTMMLYVFVIMCVVEIADNKKWMIKIALLFPSIIFAVYRNIMFYDVMVSSHAGDPGNMIEYKTILELIF